MKKAPQNYDFNWKYMSECWKCGKRNSLKESVCSQCGEKINEKEEAKERFKNPRKHFL